MAYSYCPRCRNPLHKAGKVKVMGPYGRYRLIDVYYCRVCGWRGT
jgi:RNase P subunit RPR2